VPPSELRPASIFPAESGECWGRLQQLVCSSSCPNTNEQPAPLVASLKLLIRISFRLGLRHAPTPTTMTLHDAPTRFVAICPPKSLRSTDGGVKRASIEHGLSLESMYGVADSARRREVNTGFGVAAAWNDNNSDSGDFTMPVSVCRDQHLLVAFQGALSNRAALCAHLAVSKGAPTRSLSPLTRNSCVASLPPPLPPPRSFNRIREIRVEAEAVRVEAVAVAPQNNPTRAQRRSQADHASCVNG
jgi:hypothetical protein